MEEKKREKKGTDVTWRRKEKEQQARVNHFRSSWHLNEQWEAVVCLLNLTLSSLTLVNNQHDLSATCLAGYDEHKAFCLFFLQLFKQSMKDNAIGTTSLLSSCFRKCIFYIILMIIVIVDLTRHRSALPKPCYTMYYRSAKLYLH